MKNWVFYHKACTDGAAAAYAAWTKFGPTAVYIPIIFNESVTDRFQREFVESEGLNVHFLDVTPDPKDIGVLVSAGHKVTVIDHHKTWHDFIEKCDIGAATSMMSRHGSEHSGSMLAWDVFQNTPTYPDVVLYTNDYDLHTFRFGHKTRAYQAVFELVDLDDIDAIVRFAARSFDDVYEEGCIVLATKEQYIKQIIGNVFHVVFEGESALFVAAPRIFRNEVAGELLKHVGNDGFVVVCDHQGANQYGISLRANRGSDWDLTELAKPYGGGGHETAAGFVTDSLWMFGIGEKPRKSFFERLKSIFKR